VTCHALISYMAFYVHSAVAGGGMVYWLFWVAVGLPDDCGLFVRIVCLLALSSVGG
jgi:hypothetical protein